MAFTLPIIKSSNRNKVRQRLYAALKEIKMSYTDIMDY